jgi:hypothetical protein
VLVVAIAVLVAVLVIVAALLIRHRDDQVDTGPEASGSRTTQTAPPSSSSTTTGAPAPTTAAPAPPTTAAPAPVVSGGPAVQQAAVVAQSAGTALADAQWDRARALIAGLRGDDREMAYNWGGLEAVTMVVVDARDDGSSVTLRLGEIAHEKVKGQIRTSLYCASWTMAGGRVVNMGPALQYIGQPWRDGEWSPPADAVPVVQQQCTRL